MSYLQQESDRAHMAGRGSQIKKSCDCCKRYMDHLGGKMNCFVRRMTANSKHSMIVPNRFLNHFGGKISGTIKLESPNGILYVVEVTKHMNKTVLRCGWEAFVDAHHIEENDSLLFRHIENSHFKVLILDSDDCEKVFSCAGINNTSGIQERNAYSVDISSSSRDDTIKSSGSKRFGRCQRGGSSHRRKTAKLAATSSSSEESGKDSPSEYKSLDSDDLQTTPGPDYVLSRRNYLSEAQKEKVVALIQEIRPEIAVFVAIIKKCHVQPPSPYLIISKEYAVVHFPHESATVTLQRPGKSKKWHPKFYMRKDRSMHILRGHWLDFVHDNRVQEGDICIFVPAKDGRRSTFTVHLLHGETTHSRVGTGVQKVGSRHGGTNTKIASAVHIKEEPTDGENVSSKINWHEISHESLECEDSHGRPSKPPYIMPSKSSLSPLQKKIVEEKVQAIQSEAPLYVAIMNKSSVRANQRPILEIGARYAAEHLPDRNQTMLLQWMGEIWRTKMQISNGKRWFLVGGWCKFVRDNRLRVGDICLFELKKNERKLTMTVNIIFSEQF